MTNPLAKGLELWQQSQQEMPESHEAEAKEEAEGASEVCHQGVQAVDSCLFSHLFRIVKYHKCNRCPLRGLFMYV